MHCCCRVGLFWSMTSKNNTVILLEGTLPGISIDSQQKLQNPARQDFALGRICDATARLSYIVKVSLFGRWRLFVGSGRGVRHTMGACARDAAAPGRAVLYRPRHMLLEEQTAIARRTNYFPGREVGVQPFILWCITSNYLAKHWCLPVGSKTASIQLFSLARACQNLCKDVHYFHCWKL